MFQVTTLINEMEKLERELIQNPPPREADIEAAKLFVKEKGEAKSMKLEGVHDLRGNQNSGDIECLARFAIHEHNNKENKVLIFKKIVNAREQVVARTMYHLTLEAKEADKTKNFEAKVWVKPWMNFKQLQEFKEVFS